MATQDIASPFTNDWSFFSEGDTTNLMKISTDAIMEDYDLGGDGSKIELMKTFKNYPKRRLSF